MGNRMWIFRRKQDEGEGRRNHERCKTKLPFRFRQGNHIIIGETNELSLKGAFALRSKTQGSGDVLPDGIQDSGEFSLILPDGEVQLPFTIARADSEGLAFKLSDKPAQEAQANLKDYLETQLGKIW
jgi:hypothetical protein